jgi:manganese transport protein
MPKSLSFRKGLSSLLFWSVISAAFIGPGTVTTSAKAGAGFGLQLLWALFFSIIATIFLQEAAARITIASGQSLGEVLAQRFRGRTGTWLRTTLFLAVAFGCAAYQTGNLLGALEGIKLVSEWSPAILLGIIGLLAILLLSLGSIAWIARSLGLLVALMGGLFIYLAAQSEVNFSDIFQSITQPAFPAESSLLVTALIGTTIVPYNLFLASGISRGQDLREMRFGLILAILIGGLISMAILLVGTLVPEPFSFAALFEILNQKLGPWAGPFFGLGLFAAGLSSAITAPLAAAVTGSSLIGRSPHWQPHGKYFRATWITVLGIGLLFGFLQVKPIPAIILAQAINGVLLPLVAIFLYLATNDRQVLGAQYVNKWWVNAILLLITCLAVYLGLHNLVRAFGLDATASVSTMIKWIGTLVALSYLLWFTYTSSHGSSRNSG